jgi:hypothetical protein
MLPNAPIWDDIRTFPIKYSRSIDIHLWRIPCQDISIAGLEKALQESEVVMLLTSLESLMKIRPKFISWKMSQLLRPAGGLEVVYRNYQNGMIVDGITITAASVERYTKGKMVFSCPRQMRSDSSGDQRRYTIRKQRVKAEDIDKFCWREAEGGGGWGGGLGGGVGGGGGGGALIWIEKLMGYPGQVDRK